jgi:hypothetical protein
MSDEEEIEGEEEGANDDVSLAPETGPAGETRLAPENRRAPGIAPSLKAHGHPVSESW